MKKIFIILKLVLLLAAPFFVSGQQVNKNLITFDWLINDNVSPFTSEYQAVLDRGTALGYTLPSASQQIKQNNFVVALKSAGIWNSLDILYVFATDGSSDFATLNWKAPLLYQCTKVNSPTFTTNQGFNGDGATSYLNTNWIPTTNGVKYTLNEASHFAWLNSNVQNSNMVDYGSHNTASNTQRISLVGRDASDRQQQALNSANIATAAASVLTSVGFWHNLRDGAAAGNNRVYLNGIVFDAVGTASSASSDRSIFVLAFNANVSPSLFSTRQISILGFGASLSGKESSLYTAWNNYFTSL